MIYFAQAGPDGPIKIGFSSNPLSRLPALRTASHAEVRILAIIRGSEHDESNLHRQFNAYRMRGEWFQPSQPLLDFIDNAQPIDLASLRLPRPTTTKKEKKFVAPPKPIAKEEFREWRDRMAWTQKGAADWIGCSIKTYQNWEQGCRPVRHPIMIRKVMALALARSRKAA